MNEPTCLQRDAASVIFNLPDYRVIDAIDLPLGGRRVIVQADAIEAGCPDCGVVGYSHLTVVPWLVNGVAAPCGRCVAGYGLGSAGCCGSRARSA